MEMAKNATLGDFLEKIRETYMGNNRVYKIEVAFEDGSGPLRMTYRTPEGFAEDQMQRRGRIDLEI